MVYIQSKNHKNRFSVSVSVQREISTKSEKQTYIYIQIQNKRVFMQRLLFMWAYDAQANKLFAKPDMHAFDFAYR